jgi:chitodextrinase
VVLALVAAVGPAAAAPNEDGQPAGAPSRYDATSPTGWMTSAPGDRVYDIAQIGNTVYVGGIFTGIRPTRAGTITPRSNLAAFDATTGAPVAGFAPTFDRAVYALQPSPDGQRLYVGGEFDTVNGTARHRLVALDPTTGAIATGFTPNVGGGAVRSLAQRGSLLYAGGNFASASGETHAQLAAFDTTGTGRPVATWTPAATGGSVLTIELSPDGSRLYAGGRFTAVNGSPNSGYLVALDRTTGARITSFAAQPGREVFDVLADDRGMVWTAMGGVLGRADVYRAGDGSLLTRHETAGDVESVEQVGDLVYVGGHDIGPSELEHVGVVDPAAPAILDAAAFDEPTTGGDGTWAFHSTGRDLWVGGNVSGPYYGFARYPSLPEAPAREELVPVLADWRYRDTGTAPAGWNAPGFDASTWPVGPAELGFGDDGEATLLATGRVTYHFRRTFTVADPARLEDLRLDLLVDDGAVVYLNGAEVVRENLPAGAVNDTTRALDSKFGNAEDTFTRYSLPVSSLVAGTNTIAVEVHQNAAASSDLSFDARLSAVHSVDTTPPTVPTGLVASNVAARSAVLSWTPSTDDRGVDHYDVFRDGSAAGSSTAPPFTAANLAPATTYFFRVEAVDAAGNRSGRTEPISVTTPAAPTGTFDLVARGATWRYRDDGWDGGNGAWRGLGFDDGAWRQGPAELGLDDGDEATVIGGRYQVTDHFRRTFDVGDASSVTALRLDLLADDGAVAYVNGTEVARDNLPAGTITSATDAVEYRTGQAETRTISFTVPPSVLRDGQNVLAVEVHQAWGSPDVSFDARLVATANAVDSSPPTVPTGLSAPARTSSTVRLAWNPSTDDVGVAHYEVFVDGASVGTTGSTSFTVNGLAPSSTHTAAVEAVDGAGRRSGRTANLTVTTAAAPTTPVELIPRGDTWRWWNQTTAPPAAWASRAFDDSAWPTGRAELGQGDGDEVTVLPAGYGTRWFRRAFTVTGAAAIGQLEVEILADDGAVVYLNGVELVRDNVGPGTVTADTLATDYRTGQAETRRQTYLVPATALVDGANVLAVSVHQAWGSPDISFDLRLRTA